MPRRQIITTLVTPATPPTGGAAYDLTTLAAVKEELDITDNSKNSLLRRYISGASAATAQECNRVFPVETVKDEIFPHRDPTPGRVFGRFEPLILSRYPIVSVASVVENGVTLADGVDFRIDYEKGELIRLGVNGLPTLWSQASLVAVTFSAGFDPIPSDLEDAIIRMITKRYRAKGRDPTITQQNIPGVLDQRFWFATGEDAGNMTPDVMDIINDYRVPLPM